MKSSLGAFVMAMIFAAALTPLVRRLALRTGAVDAPGGRRVHERQVPRLGGLAVVVACFAPLAILFAHETGVARLFLAEPLRVLGLAAGGLMMATLGAWDDLRGLRAWTKLWVQVLAASVAFACGFRIESIDLPFLGSLSMGVFALPVTVLWIVGIINALNLIDGLDGLAGGVAFFVCLANFVVAWLNGAPLVMLLSATLGGAILGFLLYNFNPASIFMGDSGSMFLGFVLATSSMLGAAVKSSTTVALLVPIIALGLPIMDTLFAMIRRVLERRPIFSPDRSHIHHRLLELGITHRRAVLILYGVSIVFTAAAIAVAIGRSWEVGGALLVLTVMLIGIVRFVGYFEYLFLRRRQKLRLRSRNTERLRKHLPALLRRLDAATGVDAAKDALVDFATRVEMASMDIRCPRPDLALSWACTLDGPARSSRDLVSASFPLAALGRDAQVTFRWYSDDGDVSPQADILLQMAADSLERATGPTAPMPGATVSATEEAREPSGRITPPPPLAGASS
jgi:UDP-GlcNAc:undecaprenyl-phosphate/decaprenyl-phosphate GlcNAc-1-phosphate transferase